MVDENEEANSIISDSIDIMLKMSANVKALTEKVDNQSYALREIARLLYELGIAPTRFTPRTCDTLVAVALNGDY